MAGRVHDTAQLTIMRYVRLINPNSDRAATQAMLKVAQLSAPTNIVITATTSTAAPKLITNDVELAHATDALLALFDNGLDPLDGVIVSAFGDPGVEQLRKQVSVPVVGIAEAALRRAAAIGFFSVVSTTPALANSIRARAHEIGVQSRLVSVHITEGEPAALMADARRLDNALATVINAAIDEDGAEAVIVGGGPLAEAARRLSFNVTVPIVEPIPAAVAELVSNDGTIFNDDNI